MPIQPSPVNVDASEAGHPASIAATRATGSLRLPGPRAAWTFMASPVVLCCLQGEIVPLLAKAWHVPGLGGNGRAVDNGGAGFKASLQATGYVEVPHDFPVTAFGKKRDPAQGSTYLQRFEARGVVYHADAWHRPRVYGHQTRWEFDAEGWLKFLVDIRKSAQVLDLKKLEPFQIELASQSLLAEVRRLQDREGASAKRSLAKRLVHLPADLVPPELRPTEADASTT